MEKEVKIHIPKELSEEIKKIAKKERRSYSNQMQVILESALKTLTAVDNAANAARVFRQGFNQGGRNILLFRQTGN